MIIFIIRYLMRITDDLKLVYLVDRVPTFYYLLATSITFFCACIYLKTIIFYSYIEVFIVLCSALIINKYLFYSFIIDGNINYRRTILF